MKRLLFLAVCLVSLAPALHATTNLYVNAAPIHAGCAPGVYTSTPPTIDATGFLNRSVFDVNTIDCFSVMAPYEIQNLRGLTNIASGNIIGDPGFRFNYFNTANNLRYPMDVWNNAGTVNGVYWVDVNSHYINSTGPLITSSLGLIRLQGDAVSLVRDGLRAGLTPDQYYPGGETPQASTNTLGYQNAIGITDNYWATGANNTQGGSNPPPVTLPGTLDVPCTQSPSHEVELPDGTLVVTNFPYTQSSNSCIRYKAYVYLSYPDAANPTNPEYQIVFLPENTGDTNFTIDARFFPITGVPGASAANIVVSFQMQDMDIVNLQRNTNALYLVDRAGSATNGITLASNTNAVGSRPGNYDLLRYAPDAWTRGMGPNMAFTNTILSSSAPTNGVGMVYSAYSANVNYNSIGSQGSYIGDPTNYSGRVEITGGNLNLDQTRIRAESTVLIRATTNLVNNKLPKVDALYASFDLRTQQSPLLITNLAPRSVARMSGNIYCWSGVWTNFVSQNGVTNQVKFHTLVVGSALTALQPVSIFDLFLHATNVVLSDPMKVTHAINLDASSLYVQSDLGLPNGASWAATNVPKLYWFTNEGTITMPGTGSYGTDRAFPYATFINRGTNLAAAQSINATIFEDAGSGLVGATAGMLTVNANSVKVMGNANIYITNITAQPYPVVTNTIVWVVQTNTVQQVVTTTNNVTNIVVTTNFVSYLVTNPVPTTITTWFTNYIPQIVTNLIGPRLLSSGDMQISARDMYVSNSVIQAGQGGVDAIGALIVSVTNNLINYGPSLNRWITSAGFQMLVKPTTSDLLATHITSKAGVFQAIPHTWVGQNRGAADASGYVNNMALGKLTLDGAAQSQFQFSAAPGYNNAAMYIDYLELVNYATNHVDAIYVDPNLTIYVANANVPPRKLELTHGGRIRWVPYYTGTFSTTNITYPSGRTYPFNAALVADQELDSDQDGIPNASDPTPIFVNESFALSINLLSSTPSKTVVSWTSLANMTNWLETKSPLSTNWSPLATVVSGSKRDRLSFTNSLSNEQRYYRVRTQNPPPF
jgi:hypothetical protein